MGGKTAQIPHLGFTDSESTKQIKLSLPKELIFRMSLSLGLLTIFYQQTMTSEPSTPPTECHLEIINVISGTEAMGPLPHF